MKKTILYAILGFSLAMLCTFSAFLGGLTSCTNGNGKLELTGFRCIQVDLVAACTDIQGNLYSIPKSDYELLTEAVESGKILQNDNGDLYLNLEDD